MKYTEIDFKATAEQGEVLVAVLDSAGYEMFEEYEGGLKAYIPEKQFERNGLESLLASLDVLSSIPYEVHAIEDKNWNVEWEKNYPPVTIANRIYVRTTFHPANPEIEYEIIVDPKMAFGTGHHDTTSLMLQQMLELDMDGLQVLDMGCGSGILAIFASMRGASHIEAIDIDEWAVNNTRENCSANEVSNVLVKMGDVHAIEGKAFDIVLANINRNIILRDLEEYANKILPGAHLLVSGFLPEDEAIIKETASRFKLGETSIRRSGNWSSIHFIKNL